MQHRLVNKLRVGCLVGVVVGERGKQVVVTMQVWLIGGGGAERAVIITEK